MSQGLDLLGLSPRICLGTGSQDLFGDCFPRNCWERIPLCSSHLPTLYHNNQIEYIINYIIIIYLILIIYYSYYLLFLFWINILLFNLSGNGSIFATATSSGHGSKHFKHKGNIYNDPKQPSSHNLVRHWSSGLTSTRRWKLMTFVESCFWWGWRIVFKIIPKAQNNP